MIFIIIIIIYFKNLLLLLEHSTLHSLTHSLSPQYHTHKLLDEFRWGDRV